MKSFYYTITVVFLSLTSSTSCSVSKLLVGDVDPIDNKSKIVVPALENIDANWVRIQGDKNHDIENDTPDRAWQSAKSAAVISINSACRQNADDNNISNEMGIKEIATDLLSQWRNIENKTQRDLMVSGFPAYETTAEGIYYNRKRKFQTIVVKTPTCVYDLIFLSPPKSFTQDLAVFQQFRDKLILK